ncbi:MAG: hypothetical protein K0Q97_2707 [Bacillota bacterium]|nr:hypothetical protein [Bacillota bacterium]
MKKVYRILIFLHVFVGIGALGGGYAGISNPNGPFGIPVEVLKNSPFDNFFIPGIILFTVIGMGNLFSAVMYGFKTYIKSYISLIFSCALPIFIIVQCYMMQSIVALHVIFFIIGLIQIILTKIIMFEQRLFPTNIILDFYNEKIKEPKNHA